MSNPKDLIEGLLPNHFLEQYPQFIKFLEQYYEFLESSIVVLRDNKNLQVGDNIYGSLSKAKATVRIVSSDRIYFEYNTKDNNFYKNEVLINGNTGELYYTRSVYKNIYAYMQDIEDNTCYDMVLNLFKKYFRKNVSLDKSIFRRVDPNLLTKRILDYYKNKDTENSFYWFFRIFFDETIDLYYPKVDILRLSDSDYRVRRWMQIESTDDYIRFRQARIFAPQSGSSAFVREVNTTSVNGIVKIFLDLTFINGEFLPNEQIIAYDYITGEEIGRTNTLLSVTKVIPTDGGIGHYEDDRFKFNNVDSDGRGNVLKMEKYSVTNVDLEYPGIMYKVGDYLTFDDTYTGATASANAYVESIYKNDYLTDYVNAYNKYLKNIPVSFFSSNTLFDIVEAANTFANTNLNYIFSSSSFVQEYDVGSIKSIRFNKSGLEYNFEPPVTAVTGIYAAKGLYYFDVLFDETEPNVAFMTANTEVEIYGEDSLCVGNTIIGTTSLSGLDILSEDVVARQFIFPVVNKPLLDHVLSTYLNININDPIYPGALLTFATSNISTYAPLLLTAASTVKIKSSGLTANIQDVVAVSPLVETARLSSILGDGVQTLKLSELGLNGLPGNSPVFKDLPETRTFNQPDIAHGLSADLEYEYGVVFEPFGEYLGNASKVSSDKYLQDGYYYQHFSYEIRTKVPASLIEPLLMDELHPAGFIAFIRNKFEAELKLRMLAMEFPEIEIENNAYMDTIATPFTEIEVDNPEDQLKEVSTAEFTDLEVENMYYTDTTAFQQFELELEQHLDELKGFHYFWEDVIVLPQEFDLNSFDGFMDSYEEAKIINSTVVYDLIPVVYSYLVLVNVEDEANWRTVPVKYRQGPIGNMADDTIDNLRVLLEMVTEQSLITVEGAVLIVRDDAASNPIALGNATNSYENHGLLPTAEVYTRSGWVQFQNIQPRTEIAHVEKNGKVVWKVLNKIYKQSYSGVLYQIQNNNTKFTVAPETDVVLFEIGNEYKRIPAKSINLTDSKYHIASIDETKINSPFSAISTKDALPTFKKTEINYTGDIYIISVNVERPYITVRSEFKEIDLLLSNVVDPRNYPKFKMELSEALEEIESYKHLPNRNLCFSLGNKILPYTPITIREQIKSTLWGDYLGDTIPGALITENPSYIITFDDSKKIDPVTLKDYESVVIWPSEENDLYNYSSFLKEETMINSFDILNRNYVFDITQYIDPFEPIIVDNYLEKSRLRDYIRDTIPSGRTSEEILEFDYLISESTEIKLKDFESMIIYPSENNDIGQFLDHQEYKFIEVNATPDNLILPSAELIFETVTNETEEVFDFKFLESNFHLINYNTHQTKLDDHYERIIEDDGKIWNRTKIFGIKELILPNIPNTIKDFLKLTLREYVKDSAPNGSKSIEENEIRFEIEQLDIPIPTAYYTSELFNYSENNDVGQFLDHQEYKFIEVNSYDENYNRPSANVEHIVSKELNEYYNDIIPDVNEIEYQYISDTSFNFELSIYKEKEIEVNRIIPDRNDLISIDDVIDPYFEKIVDNYNKLYTSDNIKEGLPSAVPFKEETVEYEIFENIIDTTFTQEASKISQSNLLNNGLDLKIEQLLNNDISILNDENLILLKDKISNYISTPILKYKYIPITNYGGDRIKLVQTIEAEELEKYTNLIFDFSYSNRNTESQINSSYKIINQLDHDLGVNVINEKEYHNNGFPLSEIDDTLLTSKWIDPYSFGFIDDYIDKMIVDREDMNYLHDNLKIQYTYSETFVYETSELLNSNNYIVDYSSSSNTIVTMNFIDNLRTLVPIHDSWP